MPLPLIAAASAGAAALKNLHGHGTPTVAGNTKVPNFQQLMTAMQQSGVDVKELMALSGPALQARIKTLTPQQQQSLAQQLFGAKLTMQNPAGGSTTGTVNNVRLEGNSPSLEVAGIPYTLDKIQAINQAQV